MTEEEQLRANYHKQLLELEAQEDRIQDIKNQGLRFVEDSQQALWHTLQEISVDEEPMQAAQREIDQLTEDYLAALHEEKKKILQQEEDVDEAYHRELRNIMDQEKGKN